MLDLIRQRAQSWVVKIAFGIIIIVFVFWGVGNMNSAGPNVVATVNGKPILAQELANNVKAQQNQIRSMMPDFSSEDMRALQIPEQSLQMLISRALITQEAQKLGVTVTPVELLAFLRGIPDFHGPEGKFDQATYEKAVTRQGQGVARFEQEIMANLLGEKMREYISSAVTVTPDEARRRFAFQAERRTISYVLFPIEDYAKDIIVTDEAVKAYYEANQARFMKPATTAISYIELTPAALASSMTVTEEQITAAYNLGPSRYFLRQILTTVPVNADETTKNAIRARLEKFAGDLKKGKDFNEVSIEASQEMATVAGEIGWVEARQLPEEALGALAGIGKGGVTQPVRIGERFSIFQLVETDPDYTLPEAEIKSAIREKLAENEAALHFRDVQARAEDLLAEGKPLADIAGEFNVTVKTTNAVPPQDFAYLLGLRKPSQASAIAGEKGTLIPALLETREGFILAEIAEQNAAGVDPLETVTEVIRDVLVRREAEKKAEESARAALENIARNPGALQDRLIISEPFGRTGEIPQLGFSKTLADAAFSTPIGEWLQTPFATPKGAVIAMPAESIPLNDAEWANVRERVTQGLLDAKRSQLFSAFIADLGRKAEVRITNPQILEQLQE